MDKEVQIKLDGEDIVLIETSVVEKRFNAKCKINSIDKAIEELQIKKQNYNNLVQKKVRVLLAQKEIILNYGFKE